MHPTLIARFLAPALLAAGLLLGACGSPAPEDRASVGDAPTTTTAEAEAAAADAPEVTIARSSQALTAVAAPLADAAVVAELAPTTGFGSARALLVLDRQPGWVQVQLPVRPNGATGWVPEDAVELVAGRHRVTVDLAARVLTVFEGDAVILETSVAVGAVDAPTPIGTFAVIDRIQTPDPSGSYGPFALGLGGYSETYSEFAGGDGQIGIHGTNDPSSIGQPASHGCIRVPNDVVTVLADLLALGTPVTIV